MRPSDPAAFNGTVIVTWNSGAMQAPMLIGATAERMLEDGFAVAAVTANREAIEGSGGLTEEESEYFGEAIVGKPGLRRIDPERYGTLEHPGDGYSYDIYTPGGRAGGPGADRVRSTRWAGSTVRAHRSPIGSVAHRRAGCRRTSTRSSRISVGDRAPSS